MHRFRAFAACRATVAPLASELTLAQSGRHYDASGRSVARTEWSGDRARLYDSPGRSTGRIERSGDSWRR